MRHINTTILSADNAEKINLFLTKIRSRELISNNKFQKEYTRLLTHLTDIDIQQIFWNIVKPIYQPHPSLGEDPLDKITFAITQLYDRESEKVKDTSIAVLTRAQIFDITESLLILTSQDANLHSVIFTILSHKYQISQTDFLNHLRQQKNDTYSSEQHDRVKLLLHIALDLIHSRQPVDLFTPSLDTHLLGVLDITIPILDSEEHSASYEKIFSHESFTSLTTEEKIHIIKRYFIAETNKCSLQNGNFSTIFTALLTCKLRALVEQLKDQDSFNYLTELEILEVFEYNHYLEYFELMNHFLKDDDDIDAAKSFIGAWSHYASDALLDPKNSDYYLIGLVNFIASIGERFELDHRDTITDFLFTNFDAIMRQPKFTAHIKEKVAEMLNPGSLVDKIGVSADNDRSVKFITLFFWKENPSAWWQQLNNIQSIQDIELLFDFTYTDAACRKNLFSNPKAPYEAIKSSAMSSNYKATRSLLKLWQKYDHITYNVAEKIEALLPYVTTPPIESSKKTIYDFLIYLRDNHSTDGIVLTQTLPNLMEIDKGFLTFLAQKNDLRIFLEALIPHCGNQILIDSLSQTSQYSAEPSIESHYAFIAQYANFKIDWLIEDKGYFFYNLAQHIIETPELSNESKAAILGILYDNGYFGRSTQHIQKDFITLEAIAQEWCKSYSSSLKKVTVAESKTEPSLSESKAEDQKDKTQKDKDKQKQKKKNSKAKQSAIKALKNKLTSIPYLTEQGAILIHNLNSENIDLLPGYFLTMAAPHDLPVSHKYSCYQVALTITETNILLTTKKESLETTVENHTKLESKIRDLTDLKQIIEQKLADLTNQEANKIQSLVRISQAKDQVQDKRLIRKSVIEDFYQTTKSTAINNIRTSAATKIQAIARMYNATKQAQIQRVKRDSLLQDLNLAVGDICQVAITEAIENIYHFEQQIAEQQLMMLEDGHSSKTLNDHTYALNEMIKAQRAEIEKLKTDNRELTKKAENFAQRVTIEADKVSRKLERQEQEITTLRQELTSRINETQNQAEYIRKGVAYIATMNHMARQIRPTLEQKDAIITQLTNSLNEELAKNQKILSHYQFATARISGLESINLEIQQGWQNYNAQLQQQLTLLTRENDCLKKLVSDLQQSHSDSSISSDSDKSSVQKSSDKSRFAIKRQADATNELLVNLYKNLYMNGLVTIDYIAKLKADHDANISSFNPTLNIDGDSVSLDPSYSTLYFQHQNSHITPASSPYKAGHRAQVISNGITNSPSDSAISELSRSSNSGNTSPDAETIQTKQPITSSDKDSTIAVKSYTL